MASVDPDSSSDKRPKSAGRVSAGKSQKLTLSRKDRELVVTIVIDKWSNQLPAFRTIKQTAKAKYNITVTDAHINAIVKSCSLPPRKAKRTGATTVGQARQRSDRSPDQPQSTPSENANHMIDNFSQQELFSGKSFVDTLERYQGHRPLYKQLCTSFQPHPLVSLPSETRYLDSRRPRHDCWVPCHQSSHAVSLTYYDVEREDFSIPAVYCTKVPSDHCKSDHMERINKMMPAVSIPLSISPPLNLFILEKLLFNTKAYYGCAFHTNFMLDEDGQLINIGVPQSPIKLKMFNMYCATAIRQLQLRDYKGGFACFQKALDLVEDLLMEHDPRLLECLINVSIQLVSKEFIPLYESLRDLSCGLVAKKTKGRSHYPWSQIFQQFQQLQLLPKSEVKEAMRNSWKCGYDQFANFFQSDKLSCHMNFLVQKYVRNEAQKRLDDVLLKRSREPGSFNHSRELRYALGYSLYAQGETSQARQIIDEVISTCHGPGNWHSLEVEALEISAMCAYELETDPSIAKAKLKLAIEKSRMVDGPGSYRTWGLEDSLRTWFR